jgi:hypothetical protein
MATLKSPRRVFQPFRRWRKFARNDIIGVAFENEAPPSRADAAKNAAPIGLRDEQEGLT